MFSACPLSHFDYCVYGISINVYIQLSTFWQHSTCHNLVKQTHKWLTRTHTDKRGAKQKQNCKLTYSVHSTKLLYLHCWYIGHQFFLLRFICISSQLNFHKISGEFVKYSCMRQVVNINSLRSSDAYMHQYKTPSLIQIMACRLFSRKPLSEPLLVDY